jgi:hypothetical protein
MCHPTPENSHRASVASAGTEIVSVSSSRSSQTLSRRALGDATRDASKAGEQWPEAIPAFRS